MGEVPRARVVACVECGQQVEVDPDGRYASHDMIAPIRALCWMSREPYAGPVHTVAWTLEDQRVVGRFTCLASPGALCRSMCPQSSCEEGCVAPDKHLWVAQDSCNCLDWVENCCDDVAEHYQGEEPVPVRDGEVAFVWDGDCVAWSYFAPQPGAAWASPEAQVGEGFRSGVRPVRVGGVGETETVAQP